MTHRIQRIAALLAAVSFPVTAIAQDMKTEVGEGEGALGIVAWAGYIERGETDKNFDWVTKFEADTGCKVTVKTAATSDEMVALMNEGGFDLVTASGDASLRLIAGKTVQPINTDLIPSWSKVDERLQNAPWHTVDGVHYGVPYAVGLERAHVQHRGLQGGADELERRVRADGPSGRQAERRPRAGLRRTDLHRRCGALSDEAQARARHQGSLRAERGPVQGGARAAPRAAQDRQQILA